MRSLNDAAAIARGEDPHANRHDHSVCDNDPGETGSGGGDGQALRWWAVVALSLFVAASLALFGPPDATVLPLVGIVASVALVGWALTRLGQMWSTLSWRTTMLVPAVVVALAGCFVWGAATQATIDGVPLITGSEQARSVELIDRLFTAHQATVADAGLARADDGAVRAQQGLYDAAIALRQSNARIWVEAAPGAPERMRAAIDAQARLDDAAANLLTARVAAATQPGSVGRNEDVQRAAQVFDAINDETQAALVAAADALGLPDDERPWTGVGDDPETTPTSENARP